MKLSLLLCFLILSAGFLLLLLLIDFVRVQIRRKKQIRISRKYYQSMLDMEKFAMEMIVAEDNLRLKMKMLEELSERRFNRKEMPINGKETTNATLGNDKNPITKLSNKDN